MYERKVGLVFTIDVNHVRKQKKEKKDTRKPVDRWTEWYMREKENASGLGRHYDFFDKVNLIFGAETDGVDGASSSPSPSIAITGGLVAKGEGP